MAPINRRSFVKAFAGLACAALAIKPTDAVKWKARLWSMSQSRKPIMFTTVYDDMDFGVAIDFIERRTNERMAALIQHDVEFLNQELLNGSGTGTPKGFLS